MGTRWSPRPPSSGWRIASTMNSHHAAASLPLGPGDRVVSPHGISVLLVLFLHASRRVCQAGTCGGHGLECWDAGFWSLENRSHVDRQIWVRG